MAPHSTPQTQDAASPPKESARDAAARVAFHRANRWAKPVMMVAYPIVVIEASMPVMYGESPPWIGIPVALLLAAAFCFVFWSIWIYAAIIVGWLRGPSKNT